MEKNGKDVSQSAGGRWRRILWGRFTWRRVVLTAVEVYLALLVAAWFFADWMVHHPPSRKYGPLPGEVALTSADGVKISAVWLPRPGVAHTILFSHGNAEDLGYDLPFLYELRGAGFQVFGYDYRGYGRSAGHPTEQGLYRDIEAAYTHLTGPLGIAPEHIIVLGRSVGSGPAAYLASVKPVGGLILESAFTSAFRVVIPFPLFPFDQFPNRKRLASIRCPILFIHGTSDEVIAFAHGQKLYETYEGPKQHWWVEGAGHNDLQSVAGEAYFDTLRRFGETMGKAP